MSNHPKLSLRMKDLSTTILSTLLETRSSVLFQGPPGIGKTERLLQFGKEVSVPVVIQQATGGDATDVAGFPMPVKDESGARLTRYTLSPLLTKIRDTGSDVGVLVIDELPQGDNLMQKAVGPAFHERRIGDAYLPEGWAVWATGNRVQDRAGVNKMLSHLRNRLSIVEVEAELEGWTDWAQDNGVHPMIVGFAKFKQGSLFANEVPSGDDPYCTPRSLTRAGAFLAARADGMRLPDDALTAAFVHGFIGAAAGTELIAFLRTYQYLPSPEAVIKNPDTAKVPDSNRMDAQFAAMSMAIDLANTKNVNAIATYLTRLNKELQVSAFKSLITRHKSGLMNSPVIQDWISKNKALINVSI